MLLLLLLCLLFIRIGFFSFFLSFLAPCHRWAQHYFYYYYYNDYYKEKNTTDYLLVLE